MSQFVSLGFYLAIFAAIVSGKLSQYTDKNAVDGSHLVDSESGKLIRFDRPGRKFGTFPMREDAPSTLMRRESPGNCTELTIGDLYKLPGWSKLEAAANASWGNGSYNLVLNPEQYQDRPAMLCVSSDTVMVKLSGEPICETHTQSLSGQIAESNGTVKLAYQSGSHLTQHTKVTEESSIGTRMEFLVEAGIIGIPGVLTQLSTSMTLTNSVAQETDSTADTMQTQRVEQNGSENNTCHLDIKSTTCEYDGTGTILFFATGYVWFNYNAVTLGHYKWDLNIEDTLPDIRDYSSTMAIAVSGKIITNSDHIGVCEQ